MAKQAVNPIPASPPRYGLLIAAPTIEGSTDRWQWGIEWDAEACDGGGALNLNCQGNTSAMTLTPGGDTHGLADPFVVWAGDSCSTIGFAARDYEGRARRLMAAQQSAHVAHEFWTGDIAIANGLDNIGLADVQADTLTSAGVGIVDAIALLEDGLADAREYGGMIHLTNGMLVRAVAAQAVRLNGQVWQTPLGTTVVADAGYPGTGPNGEPVGATQWIYATSGVQVYLSPIDIIPGSFDDAVARAQMIDLVNMVEIRVERLAMIQTDWCAHFAVEVDYDAPLLGGTS
jgi:hypothetical protein